MRNALIRAKHKKKMKEKNEARNKSESPKTQQYVTVFIPNKDGSHIRENRHMWI